jgi:riboflavin synthase
MFTGIITNTAKVLKTEKKNGSLFLTVERPKVRGKNWKITLGDSISTDGVCLTVAHIGRSNYTCELMTETLKKSYFGLFIPKRVNLEQAMKLGDRLDGHFVLGHVDTVGKIYGISKEKSGIIYAITFPKQFSKLVVPKGSVTLDGISLTVVDTVKKKTCNLFSVSLVNYSLTHTTIRDKKIGDPVNLEFDILGKYLLK